MEAIKKFIREQVEEAAGGCMPGDLSIPQGRAIEIADKAVGLVIDHTAALLAEKAQTIPETNEHLEKRLELACSLTMEILDICSTKSPDERRPLPVELAEARTLALHQIRACFEDFSRW